MTNPERRGWVGAHVARSIGLWNECAASGPVAATVYTPAQQKRREAAYDEGVRAVEDEVKTEPLTRTDGAAQQHRGPRRQVFVDGVEDRGPRRQVFVDGVEDRGPRRQVLVDGVEDRLIAHFGRFATTALGLEDEAVHTITHHFIPVGRQLARWTRRFDPAMTRTEIVQACRNAWTACGLQPILGRPTELTPSILGYSLMYPYSDNYLDRADIAGEAKSRFSARFRERLRGDVPPPMNEREAALWTLVGLVEGEYPRELYPQIFESLLAIHAAQERSIAQLRNGGRATDVEVLEISCEKGGTSVLADAFLAAGALSEAEARFAFNWGVLLQLGDDLQDLGDDLRRQSATLFTRAVRRGEPLDALVNQLLAFSDRVAAGMDELPHATPMLRGLLRMSWRSLIVEAVADARACFTRRFLRELERTSPFRLKFLRKRHQKLMRRRGMYESLFDRLVEAHDEDARGIPLPDCSAQPTAGKPASAMAISSAG